MKISKYGQATIYQFWKSLVMTAVYPSLQCVTEKVHNEGFFRGVKCITVYQYLDGFFSYLAVFNLSKLWGSTIFNCVLMFPLYINVWYTIAEVVIIFETRGSANSKNSSVWEMDVK